MDGQDGAGESVEGELNGLTPRSTIAQRVAALAVAIGTAVTASALSTPGLAEPAERLEVPGCYADFIDDHETEVSRALKAGADTLYYTVAPAFSERVQSWIDEAMAQLDRIVAFDVVRAVGEPHIRIRLGRTLGHAGLTTRHGDILLPESIEANTSGGLPRGPRTIAHEIGHAVGLSHPGHDEAGRRPDDWNTAGLDSQKAEGVRDGMNTHSDTRVVRTDGETPLGDRDTVMAFVPQVDALDPPASGGWMRSRYAGCTVLAAALRAFGSPPTEAVAVRQPNRTAARRPGDGDDAGLTGTRGVVRETRS